MKRNSDDSIIPKIIIILGTVSILGIILLFLRPRPASLVKAKRAETPAKLFAQVIDAATPVVLKLWEQGDLFFPKQGPACDQEILHEKNIGRNYYQCNPHFWQCFWSGGTKSVPSLEVKAFGQTYHVRAKPVFGPIKEFSQAQRFYSVFKGHNLPVKYGYRIELEIREIRGFRQPLILTDSCRDTYLPQRVYGYSKVKDKREDGFLWDNFDRHLFLDKFYVTNRQLNEWYLLEGENAKLILDRKKWPLPAIIPLKEQIKYCAFFGKRLLEAHLFDAATMTPSELNEPNPLKVLRPDTPWQRDISKTFLGIARINPDYQLTPLDCELAQVQGCKEKYFTTDSASWMGINYALGFYPESLRNSIEEGKNLKLSSRFLAPASLWHELGVLSDWDGTQNNTSPVAFRCYEEAGL